MLAGQILNLILGFSCFGLMISGKWLSGRLGFCCLGLMAGDWFFFSFSSLISDD
jgi:hypothetical protein